MIFKFIQQLNIFKYFGSGGLDSLKLYEHKKKQVYVDLKSNKQLPKPKQISNFLTLSKIRNLPSLILFK